MKIKLSILSILIIVAAATTAFADMGTKANRALREAVGNDGKWKVVALFGYTPLSDELISQSEAEAGTSTTPRAFSALRVSQAISAQAGGGMSAATYDPQSIAGDVFDLAVHTGTIAHDSVRITGTGTNSHATIDTFIASKAQASGLASLNANSLVVQNPASGTTTVAASSIPIADGSGKIADGWLSSNVSLLGQTIAHDSAVITGTGTNSHATIDAHIADTADPHGASLTQTNISVTTGTVTTLYNTTFSGSVGTFTGALGVGGTVTATGFVGNGSGLTGLSTGATWSGLTGNPEGNGSITVSSAASTIPIRDASQNLFAAGIVGGTTTGALRIPVGTTAQRPASPKIGMIRTVVTGTYYAASGGAITTSGTYTIHSFTASGNFIPAGTRTVYSVEFYDGTNWTAFGIGTPVPVVVECLVVAGGGGTVAALATGAGGAGGLIYHPAYVLAREGTTTITIGAGGGSAASGNNTTIASTVVGVLTAIGGGSGGWSGAAAAAGGSGGGGQGRGSSNTAGAAGIQAAQAGDSGTYGFGNNGGNGWWGGSDASSYGPGGGGAGAAAANASNGASTAGGIGKQYSISGVATYYAGGGGGNGSGGINMSGGLGGGGAGSANGTANTGGGGGGGGGIGGSGIVIIRYPTP